MPRYTWKIKNEERTHCGQTYIVTTIKRTVEYGPNEIHLVRPDPLKNRHHGMLCTHIEPLPNGGLSPKEKGKYKLRSIAQEQDFNHIITEMGATNIWGRTTLSRGTTTITRPVHPMEREFANS